MHFLPDVIIDIILEYDGRIKRRNGYYADQIDLRQEKYDIIRKYIGNKPTILSKIPQEYTIFDTVFYTEENTVGMIFSSSLHPGIFVVSVKNGQFLPPIVHDLDMVF